MDKVSVDIGLHMHRTEYAICVAMLGHIDPLSVKLDVANPLNAGKESLLLIFREIFIALVNHTCE